MNVSNGKSSESRCTKTTRFEKWLKKGLLMFAQLRIFFKTRKQKFRPKNWTKRKIAFQDFWKRRSKTGKWKLFQRLSWVNIEYINQFIISVRTKDDNEYETNFLRSLVATIGDKISWDSFQQNTLATTHSLFGKKTCPKSTFPGYPSLPHPNQCCTAVDKARRKQKNTTLSRGCGGGGHLRTELEIDSKG